MTPGSAFPEGYVARLRETCQSDPCVAALYAFDPEGSGDYELAALYTKIPTWPERLDLEMAVAEALGMEGVELVDLRRMPLLFRYDVVSRGDPLFVGNPETLAIFIEQTVARYSAFYPLLEASTGRCRRGRWSRTSSPSRGQAPTRGRRRARGRPGRRQASVIIETLPVGMLQANMARTRTSSAITFPLGLCIGLPP